MLETINFIIHYIVESFMHIWPYLLVTIPIAVAVQMSGMSRYIRKAFSAQPILAIFLATFVGAFSPLCSCSVIPVIAALLIGGVPLAPVMSFWLASPSMDPEIFFLTVGTLGWELAVWRLGGTLVLSLGGGFIVHLLQRNSWLGDDILRDVQSTRVRTMGQIMKQGWGAVSSWFTPKKLVPAHAAISASSAAGECTETSSENVCSPRLQEITLTHSPALLSVAAEPAVDAQHGDLQSCEEGGNCRDSDADVRSSFLNKLGRETWGATTMVIKFMLLAWTVGALVRLFVPEEWIISVLGVDNTWAIIIASLLGVPVYTSNLAAMPLVSGLLANGMNPAAGLAFLISGPITTLPAMSAVWGLVNRKVFALYISFALFSAVLIGYAYQLVYAYF